MLQFCSFNVSILIVVIIYVCTWVFRFCVCICTTCVPSTMENRWTWSYWCWEPNPSHLQRQSLNDLSSPRCFYLKCVAGSGGGTQSNPCAQHLWGVLLALFLEGIEGLWSLLKCFVTKINTRIISLGKARERGGKRLLCLQAQWQKKRV